MVVKEDELELACCMKNTWRVERGNGWLGEEEGDFLYRKLISPDWYYETGLMGSGVLRPKKQWGPGHQSRFIEQPGLMPQDISPVFY
jgi:hypothetical protein